MKTCLPILLSISARVPSPEESIVALNRPAATGRGVTRFGRKATSNLMHSNEFWYGAFPPELSPAWWFTEQTTYSGAFVITGASRLAEDLQLGRLGLVKLALYLEEIFDVELSDELLGRFVTVADIVRYLSRDYVPESYCVSETAA